MPRGTPEHRATTRAHLLRRKVASRPRADGVRQLSAPSQPLLLEPEGAAILPAGRLVGVNQSLLRKSIAVLGLASLALLGALVAMLPSEAAAVIARTPTELRFRPPAEVLGIAIASEGPGQMWYYPTAAAGVTSRVFGWLRRATATFVSMPKPRAGLPLVMDYMGPAQLAFTDEYGEHIMVYPAFYLSQTHDQGRVFVRFPYPGVLVYRTGAKTFYLKSPALYRWLKRDVWKATFVPEMYTPAESRAVHTVLASSWHRLFQTLFPPSPGSTACDIPHGGPIASTLQGTCLTYADPASRAVLVTLTEIWSNGAFEHTWSFEVSSKGRILRSTQAGVVAPQDWK